MCHIIKHFHLTNNSFLILNLAIGGGLGGQVNNSIFPTAFEIDYVRVYTQDYAQTDKENPIDVTKLSISQLKNTIHWKASTDDRGVEKYAIYVNEEIYDFANLNQYTFKGLDKK